MKKVNIILGLVLALVLGLLLYSYYDKRDAEKDWESQTREQQLQVYFDLTRESILLQEKLGKTPYITMLRSVKGNMITSGMTKEQALENAGELIVAEQALIWYAEEHDIHATDKDVANYIKTYVIEEVKNAEGFDQMEEACHKAGMTFEDSIWAYESSYKSAYIASQIENYDEGLMAEITEQYKASDAYRQEAEIIENCRALIAAGETDNDVLRRSGIYFEH